MCIRYTNKIVGYFVRISLSVPLEPERHCKTFNINEEKPKFYSSTVVLFALSDLLETKKVQEAKFRDCHWCIWIHFASVYFDEK